MVLEQFKHQVEAKITITKGEVKRLRLIADRHFNFAYHQLANKSGLLGVMAGHFTATDRDDKRTTTTLTMADVDIICKVLLAEGQVDPSGPIQYGQWKELQNQMREEQQSVESTVAINQPNG